jgi:hypothetical protein
VQVAVRSIARGTHGVIGWSYKRGAAVIAAGDQQSRRDIGPVLAPEELDVTLEYRPQADTRAKPAIIEQEGRACDPVCADDALIAVNRQQHACSTSLLRRYRDDPLSTELLTKKSLFYRARRSYGERTSQRVRSFGEFRIYGGDVQDCYQSAVRREHRRTRAAQVDVSRPKMLASVNGDSPLFGDDGADTVCALPSSDHTPPAKFPNIGRSACASSPRARPRRRAITEQDGISRLTGHLV